MSSKFDTNQWVRSWSEKKQMTPLPERSKPKESASDSNKQNWFTRAMMTSMIAENPSVAAANGYRIKPNGDVVQEDTPESRQLSKNLAMIGAAGAAGMALPYVVGAATNPINIETAKAVGKNLLQGAFDYTLADGAVRATTGKDIITNVNNGVKHVFGDNKYTDFATQYVTPFAPIPVFGTGNFGRSITGIGRNIITSIKQHPSMILSTDVFNNTGDLWNSVKIGLNDLSNYIFKNKGHTLGKELWNTPIKSAKNIKIYHATDYTGDDFYRSTGSGEVGLHVGLTKEPAEYFILKDNMTSAWGKKFKGDGVIREGVYTYWGDIVDTPDYVTTNIWNIDRKSPGFMDSLIKDDYDLEDLKSIRKLYDQYLDPNEYVDVRGLGMRINPYKLQSASELVQFLHRKGIDGFRYKNNTEQLSKLFKKNGNQSDEKVLIKLGYKPGESMALFNNKGIVLSKNKLYKHRVNNEIPDDALVYKTNQAE